MKILYYNWVDYLDVEKRGGGVTVYQRNLIDKLVDNKEHQIYFLASGLDYSIHTRRPYVKEERSYKGARKFTLINSEVLSPGQSSFFDSRSIRAELTTSTFDKFISSNGPFDVIHFNNLEGLPAEVLHLKDRYPDTKFIYSMHNYFAVCPQVNLWYREKENCLDYDGGRKCATCLLYEPNPKQAISLGIFATTLRKVGIKPETKAFAYSYYLARLIRSLLRKAKASVGVFLGKGDEHSGKNIRIEPLDDPTRYYFRERRGFFVGAINDNCDAVIAVSEQVKNVATKFGIDPSIIVTSYIGTKMAESYSPPDLESLQSRLQAKNTIRIGYLGYMRKDKGFYFLLDALETMPDELTGRIDITIAAKMTDESVIKRLAAVADKFNSIDYMDGYTHAEIDGIYEALDLSVVPVLWEDNLPQVAIESVCHHVPVMASNLGGAKELCGSDSNFVFEAGNIEDFVNKLGALVKSPTRLLGYWTNSRRPVTMGSHIEWLIDMYKTI
jgi:glycosyltransferase involved in cell wall biosynthesis